MNKHNNKYYFAVIILMSLFIVITSEWIHRGSFHPVYDWIFKNSSGFFLSYLLVFCLMTLLSVIFLRMRVVSFLSLTLGFFISLVSSIKTDLRGEPLLPWDILLMSESLDIIYSFPGVMNLSTVVFVLSCLLLIFFITACISKHAYQLKSGCFTRGIIALCCFLLVFAVSSNKWPHVRNALGIEIISWDQKENYSTNGLLLSFFMNFQWIFIEQPSEYNKDKIEAVLKNIERKSACEDAINPNIIMVMSEAFWDPCVMDNISFSEDPIPFFRSLQKTHTSGWLQVPVFGGATVNTEFEVLTANSMHFLPKGSISYAQYVRGPMDSLASILARQGYRSTAIHSYHNWFYGRNEVYKNLGFNRFISGEFFGDAEYKGDYIADTEISRMIIEETQKSEEPDFIFAVTMQNHGPYFVNDNNITVDGTLSEEGKHMLESYATGLTGADNSLRMLVDYFKKSDEPAIIVFWGDHLPLLGENYQVYKEAGFINNLNTAREYKMMYSVPVLIWSNYLPKRDTIDFSSSYLGPYLLSITGKCDSEYMKYLYPLSESMPFIFEYETVWGENEYNKNEMLEAYRSLQYDIIFGKKYLYCGNEPQVTDPEYFIGREQMNIDKIICSQEQEQELYLELLGSSLVPGSRIYINGELQPSEYIAENWLRVFLAEKNYDELDKLDIKISLLDSRNNVIAEAMTQHLLEYSNTSLGISQQHSSSKF